MRNVKYKLYTTQPNGNYYENNWCRVLVLYEYHCTIPRMKSAQEVQ